MYVLDSCTVVSTVPGPHTTLHAHTARSTSGGAGNKKNKNMLSVDESASGTHSGLGISGDVENPRSSWVKAPLKYTSELRVRIPYVMTYVLCRNRRKKSEERNKKSEKTNREKSEIWVGPERK